MRAGQARLVVLGLALAVPAHAGAAMLQVANTGIDGPTCGSAAPCRSIARAVAHAAPGDSISVGPGVYGDDLDADGVLGEPGEEPTTGLGSIVIDKPLRIVSQLGAASTSVQTTALAFNVRSSDVVLGARNRGFTVATPGVPIIVSGAGGARTGPGPDPADAACDLSAQPTTVTAPFLAADPTRAQAPLR